MWGEFIYTLTVQSSYSGGRYVIDSSYDNYNSWIYFPLYFTNVFHYKDDITGGSVECSQGTAGFNTGVGIITPWGDLGVVDRHYEVNVWAHANGYTYYQWY